ncbi:FxsA family protein [Luteipulveratus mongoliensis]|uniref:FxsA family protein n=1 Tax=Luteipulveratus mongoliensis TaxID=571913 RepID=UPI0006973DD9|nr:FxsA family protein [Luteipulveratus mongoliensis]
MANSASGPRRRSGLGRLLRAAPLLVLLLEVLVLILVARAIGWWTLPALLVLSFIGLIVISRTGRRSWREMRDLGRTGKAPERSASDAVINVIGGVLLLVPGFVTAVIGLVLLIPASHRPVRRLASFLAARGVWQAAGVRVYGGAGRSFGGGVVPGQVVQDDQTPPTRSPGPAPSDPSEPRVIEGRIVDED